MLKVGTFKTKKFNSHDKTYFDFLAQLVDRLNGNQKVVGSTPIEINILMFYHFSLNFIKDLWGSGYPGALSMPRHGFDSR